MSLLCEEQKSSILPPEGEFCVPVQFGTLCHPQKENQGRNTLVLSVESYFG